MASYPNFHGLKEEGASDFCDKFELTCILANQSDEQKCKMFPYLLKETARRWFHGLDEETKWDWLRLKMPFLTSLIRSFANASARRSPEL